MADSGISVLFELRSSRIFSLLLFSGYSLAILIVFLLPVVLWIKVASSVLLVFLFVCYLSRDAWLLLPVSIVAIRIEGDEAVLLRRRGRELRGVISGDSVVTPFLTILRILPHALLGVSGVIIFPDSMDGGRFRELRVLLKWGKRS